MTRRSASRRPRPRRDVGPAAEVAQHRPRRGPPAEAIAGDLGPRRLDLDEIDHLAALSPGGGSITRALIRRIRGLEARMRDTGRVLQNFVGEDEQEGAELAAISRDLIALADEGTAP